MTRRRRSNWEPAPFTPAELLPGLTILTIGLALAALLLAYSFWGAR